MNKFKHLNMRLISLKGCRLAIGSYPYFSYDASNGGGEASIAINEQSDLSYLSFNPKKFNIPALTWKTTKILFLPMPPGLKITMNLNKLEGSYNKSTGELSLIFDAKFIFTIWPAIKFPPLEVKTNLGTNRISTLLHNVQGKAVQKNGTATLVGVAIVPPTGNKLLDQFLGLPNEALAILQCKIINSTEDI